MHNTNGDKLAEDVMNAYADFETHFYAKGPFPMLYFKAFFEVVVRYTETIKNSPMINRKVASAVNGLREMLEKSSHAPGQAISDADRLECMLFSEYDPYFEGDEPPGL